MADLETLKGLLAQVQTAKAPDYRLDQMLFAHMRGWSFPLHGAALYDFRRLGDLSRFTGSLDAAVGYVAEHLPGWSLEFRLSGFGTPAQAALQDPMKQPAPGYDTRVDHPAGVPALALCAALLSALIAQAEQGASR